MNCCENPGSISLLYVVQGMLVTAFVFVVAAVFKCSISFRHTLTTGKSTDGVPSEGLVLIQPSVHTGTETRLTTSFGRPAAVSSPNAYSNIGLHASSPSMFK